MTKQSQGVYFEAGYALGLGIPVFWSVHKEEESLVHFDTKQYNHIIWKNEKDLEDQLYQFIIHIIGKGSAKNN